MPAPAATRGFTLLELLIAAALAGILAAIAWPAYTAQIEQSRRADAAAALLRVELAQAGFHAHHGLYTRELRALGVPAQAGDGGRWQIELTRVHAEGWRAQARNSAARSDDDCAVLTLEVEGLQVRRGPALRCWPH